MAADLPENYEARLDAFQFIRDVPTDWETSKTLQGDIGEFIVVARLQGCGASHPTPLVHGILACFRYDQ